MHGPEPGLKREGPKPPEHQTSEQPERVQAADAESVAEQSATAADTKLCMSNTCFLGQPWFCTLTTMLCCAVLPCAGDVWQPYGAPPALDAVPPYANPRYEVPDARTPYDGPDAHTPYDGPDARTPYAYGSYDGPYAHQGKLCQTPA